jgi:hypothetical protein
MKELLKEIDRRLDINMFLEESFQQILMLISKKNKEKLLKK